MFLSFSKGETLSERATGVHRRSQPSFATSALPTESHTRSPVDRTQSCLGETLADETSADKQLLLSAATFRQLAARGCESENRIEKNLTTGFGYFPESRNTNMRKIPEISL